MAIDVGPGATDKNSVGSGTYTIICKTNPANATGTIDHIEIYDTAVSSTHNVASFENISGEDFTARARATNLVTSVGLNTYNAPGDFTAFAITINDYIGIYGDQIERETDSELVWYLAGDQTQCVGATFTANYQMNYALYATGTEAGAAASPTGVFYGPFVGPLGGPI